MYLSRGFLHQRVLEDTPDFHDEITVEGFHLATDVQPQEQLQVILERGHLLLPYACNSQSGSNEHLQFVSTNGVINRLGSFQNFLCVKDSQIHTLFLKGVDKLFYHADKGADIFGE